MRAIPKVKWLNAIAMLQHGRSTHQVSKFLGIYESTCSRICNECLPHVEPSGRGHPRSTTPIQRRVCVRAITVGELNNNVVDVKNALTEDLNMVESTNTMRHALHEASQVCALQVRICSTSSRLDYP